MTLTCITECITEFNLSNEGSDFMETIKQQAQGDGRTYNNGLFIPAGVELQVKYDKNY